VEEEFESFYFHELRKLMNGCIQTGEVFKNGGHINQLFTSTVGRGISLNRMPIMPCAIKFDIETFDIYYVSILNNYVLIFVSKSAIYFNPQLT
jgi:hypothetical protein